MVNRGQGSSYGEGHNCSLDFYPIHTSVVLLITNKFSHLGSKEHLSFTSFLNLTSTSSFFRERYLLLS